MPATPPASGRRRAAAAVAASAAGLLLLAALLPLGGGATGAGPGADAAPFGLVVAPLLSQARQAVRGGEWPLWHARAGAGYPLAASGDGQLLHPFTLPLYPLPAAAWLPALVLLRVGAGLGLAWLLLRRHGVPPVPAALAAAVHGAGVAATAAQPLGTFAAVAPGLLLAAGEVVREPRRRRSAAALLAALAAVLLTAEPAPAAVSLVAAAAFLAAACRPLPPAERRDRLGRAAALAAVAVLACAPVVALSLAWAPHTAGARDFAEQRDHRLLTDPLDLERGLGLTTRPQAPPPGPVEAEGALALAALAVAAAALAALAWRRRLPHVPFFAALAAVALLVLARPPVVSSLLDVLWLPPSDWWRHPALPWLSLALAWLAAAAFGGAAETPPAPTASRRAASRRAAALLAGVAAAAAAAALAAAPAAPAADGELVAHLQALQAERGYGRIAATGVLLPPELAARSGLADVRGRGDRLPAAYLEAVLPLRAPAPAPGAAGRLDEVSHPLYDLLAVRWLATPPDYAGPPPGRLAARLAGAAVWERGSALPLLFLPSTVQTAPPPDGWRAFVWHQPDFRARTLAQPPAVPVDGGSDRPAAATGTLEIGRITAARIDAVAELAAAGLVASSLFQDGGWRAVADSAAGDVHAQGTVLANGPFAATWMGPGRHRLSFLYRPPALLPAAAATGLGLALAAALLLAPPRRTGRRR